jgi:transposase
VDNLPIIITWLLKMQVHTIIDAFCPRHGNWQGISYGQLALLFVAYVIQCRTHRLMGMEKWLQQRQTVITKVTGWQLGDKEATDDRLGLLLTTLGEDEEQGVKIQRQLGQHLIQAFALPTEVGRYDTSSFSVHHAAAENGEDPHTLLRFGHSKDKQPGLLQFKQGLGVIDPAGVPLLTHTMSGKTADDGLYLPAWWQMGQTMGRKDFLFVADCKAAAKETRAGIASNGGFYLFPLPMTGDTPQWLQEQVAQAELRDIVLPEIVGPSGDPKVVGKGVVVSREMSQPMRQEMRYTWTEQWFVMRSDSLAQRQRARLERQLTRTEQELRRLRPKKDESAALFAERADKIVAKRNASLYFDVQVQETIRICKRYTQRGRPGPDSPYELEVNVDLSLGVTQQQADIEQARQMAGWRIHVSNTTPQQVSLEQSVRYYRDEWLVENGFHRFKNGSLPALPLYLRLPERIRGLMLLLLIALQALTLLEFVSKRSLAEKKETIAGLVPGNPKMKTDRPSAERLLAAFDQFHLLVVETEAVISATLVETLAPLQQLILDLLDLPASIYDLDLVQTPP